jgi:tetratricopeptide (TPR) repeat protein
MDNGIWRKWNKALAARLASSGMNVDEQAQRLALAVDEARTRGDQRALWAALNGLCKMHLAAQRVEVARSLAEEALRLSDEMFGERSPESGTVLSDLIFVEALSGRLERAQPLVARLIAIIMDQVRRGLNQAFSYNLSSLATFFTVQGADDQAERLLWRVIKQGEDQDRVDPDLLLFVYENLANFYLAKEEPEKSREVREKALEVMERAGYAQSTPAEDNAGAPRPRTLH